MIVFDGKMGMRKFGSAALPFGKVACAVKVYYYGCYVNTCSLLVRGGQLGCSTIL